MDSRTTLFDRLIEILNRSREKQRSFQRRKRRPTQRIAPLSSSARKIGRALKASTR